MKRLLFIIGVLVMSCNNDKKTNYAPSSSDEEIHPGKVLMETNCNVCHSPKGSHDNRLAPPMAAVKMHYFSEDISKEEFVANIQNWVNNPNVEDAKMFGAVRRFGVMAKTPFLEESVQQIADYMYSHDLEKPEWFEDHVKEMGEQQQL